MLNGDLSRVKDLLNTIGSPFNPQTLEPNRSDTIELYRVARKNKIGLLYLEKLADKGLVNAELKQELEKQRDIQETLRTTAERAAIILNKADHKYAIVKSTYPFPVVLSDVDVLIFGGTKEYNSAIHALTGSYFELMGEAPLESMLHDTRGKHSQERLAKDPCDVDVYKEIGAGYIKYLDKNKFNNHHFSEITSNGVKLTTLNAPSELALNIFHSIYPERIFTLLLHYYILYTIKRLSPSDKIEFLQVCHNQRITKAVLLIFNLVETIQEICYGGSPKELTDLRDTMGERKYIRVDKIPFNYSAQMLLDSFWSKRNDLTFARSMIRQAIAMLNPKYAKFVFAIFKERGDRDTY